MTNPQQDAYIIEVPVTLAVAIELKTYACSLDEQQTLAHTLRKRTEGLPFLRFLAVGNKELLLQSGDDNPRQGLPFRHRGRFSGAPKQDYRSQCVEYAHYHQ